MPRKEERIPYLNEVILQFASGRREARITDLSAGGCYVDSIASVPEGESVSLELAATDGRTMQFSGKIAYILPGFGFGIEFTDRTEEQAAFLATLITTAA